MPSLGRAIVSPFAPAPVARPLPPCGATSRCVITLSMMPYSLASCGAHEEVSFHVAGHIFDGLAGVQRVDLLQAPLEADHLAGLDLDVGALPLEPAGHLVDQDSRVRQRHPLSFRAAREKQRAHAHRDPDADRLHVGLDELHRVVDRKARVDRAARRVDVEEDVLVRDRRTPGAGAGRSRGSRSGRRRASRGRRCARRAGASRCRTRARRATSARQPSGSEGSCAHSLLAAGCPQFLLCRGAFFLAGRPDALARLRKLLRDRLDLGGDPVDRLSSAAGRRGRGRRRPPR